MSTYSPDQAPEPEIGEEPCRHCGGDCGSPEECEYIRTGRLPDNVPVGWTTPQLPGGEDNEEGAPF